MIQKTLTIKLPESVETLHKLVKFLLRCGLISEKEALTIKQDKTAARPVKKSRWTLAAEEMSEENLLRDGPGEELRKYIHEFREGFALRGAFLSSS